MGSARFCNNQWVKRAFFGISLTILPFFFSLLNLPTAVNSLITASWGVALFVFFESMVQRKTEKKLRRGLYQLLGELDLGLINLSKLSSDDAVAEIINKLQEHSLYNLRFQDELYSRIGLGFLTFAEDLRIVAANMVGLVHIFEKKDPHGLSLGEYLIARSSLTEVQKTNTEFHFSNVIGMGSIQWKISCGNFIDELEIYSLGKKYSLKLSYMPNYTGNKITSVCIIIQDISEHKKVQSQAVRREQEIEKIFALLQVSDSLFELFMDETRELFDEIKKDLKQLRHESNTNSILTISERMFRSVHTIKANSKLFKLVSIEDVSHEVETYLAELKEGKVEFSNEALQQLTRKVIAISEEIYSYASLRKEILSSFDRKKDLNLKYRIQWIRSLLSQFAFILRNPSFEPWHLKDIKREFGRALSSFDKLSLKDYIKGYNNMVHDIAVRSHKKVAALETQLDAHYFDGKTLARINDILVHCLRNAVDHGIETPEVRGALGKSEAGTIKIKSYEVAGNIQIIIEDDGRGVDFDKVKKKAVASGLATEASLSKMQDHEVLELLFHPGFTTTDRISHISGRGLGMDAIRESARQLHGNLIIQQSPKSGATVVLEIPSNTEELLNLFSIFDLKRTTQSLVNEFNALTSQIELKLQMEEAFVFGDRWIFAEIFRQVIQEILKQSKQQGSILVKVKPHVGRRRLDSHNFFRFEFMLKTNLVGFGFFMSQALERVSQRLEKMYGSLILKDVHNLELNLPSNIPLPLSDYEFPILVFCRYPDKIIGIVERFFQRVVSNWKYDIIACQPDAPLPQRFRERTCIVIMEGDYVGHYISVREEDERRHDGVLFMTTEYTEIENLSETSILPENIMFVPMSLDNHSFDRGLAAMILRRFLKEMANSSSTLNDIDREILEKMAV